MKRSRPAAFGAFSLGVSLLLGCQYVLGIHGGTPEDAGTASPGTDATFVPAENTGGGPAIDADRGGQSGRAGAAGGQPGNAGGIAGDVGRDTGGHGEAGKQGSAGGLGGDGSGSTGGKKVTPDDAGAGGDASSEDGAVDAQSSPEGVLCATPWHASAEPAHLLAVNSGGATACGYGGRDLPSLVAALDTTNFRAAAACGACLRVRAVTSGASVVVPVLEASGSRGVLLSREAMDQIAAGADVATVDWTLVGCDVGTSPVRYRIKDGTTASYLAVQVRNTRYPLASVSIVTTAGLLPLTLRNDGAWERRDVGPGPVTFRLTDVNGQSFDDPNVRLVPQSEVVGKGQFPPCH